MHSKGKPAVVDVERGQGVPNCGTQGHGRRGSDQGEEYNQLLPNSPTSTSSSKASPTSLTNLSRFLSRSQNQIQFPPTATTNGRKEGTAQAQSKPPKLTLKLPQNVNNNGGQGEEVGRNEPSSPSSSSDSPTGLEKPRHTALTLDLNPGQTHSYSAPASPSGRRSGKNHVINNNHNAFTLTSIDSKLRKWIGNKYSRVRKRVIFKNGEVNLSQTNISKLKRRYLADIFTTLVDIQWRWTLLVFSLSFILSWLFFAIVWWSIGYFHGDLDPDNLIKMGTDPPEWKPCFVNFYGFTSAFLFSIETQHTIGYGSRFTTEECPIGIFTMCMQSIMGVMIQAVMVGVIFAKMSRPKKRTQTLMFSRHAVVNQRDGELCLMFRVGDMRKSHIICANVRAQLIKRRVTKEGEVLPYYQHELKVGVDSDQVQIFFIWPMMVVHKIDKESPLYGLSASELLTERFEIVVSLEGVIETTGATTQARSSYLPSEILWGYRFEPMVSFCKEIGEYAVDHTLFNHTYEVDTPQCSAKELDEFNNLQSKIRNHDSNKLLSPFRVPPVAQYSLP